MALTCCHLAARGQQYDSPEVEVKPGFPRGISPEGSKTPALKFVTFPQIPKVWIQWIFCFGAGGFRVGRERRTRNGTSSSLRSS